MQILEENWTTCRENFIVYKNQILTSLEEPPSATQICILLPPPGKHKYFLSKTNPIKCNMCTNSQCIVTEEQCWVDYFFGGKE